MQSAPFCFLCSLQAKANAEEVAARQLGSREAVVAVWPLVEPYLLQDVEHVSKHKGGSVQGGAQGSAAWCCHVVQHVRLRAWHASDELLTVVSSVAFCELLSRLPEGCWRAVQAAARGRNRKFCCGVAAAGSS